MRAVIDRIEGKLAVLLIGDDGSIKVSMPAALIPAGCREGDVLDIAFKKDENATQEAKDRSKSLMEKLKKKRPSGLIKDASRQHQE